MSRFKPGVSGNPGGRPAGLSKVAELARAHSERAIDTMVAALEDADVGVRLRAAELLLNRAWGKPSTALDEHAQAAREAEQALLDAKVKEVSRRARNQEELDALIPPWPLK